ncbi:transposase [Vibrio navarrensis]|uniref:transposase n=1 Tax=Vibrio navarrensis TaxID=29495 RepID=UPI001D05009D
MQFLDSTKIEVCHIIRAKRNKVFEGVACHGKGTMDWSFGFKLHLIINHLGSTNSGKTSLREIVLDDERELSTGFRVVYMGTSVINCV